MQAKDNLSGLGPAGLASAFRAWWSEASDAGPFVRDGVVVLDANALLHLYRVTPTAREQIFAVLLAVQERLWIPHQAALEFHRNRTDVVLGRMSQFREVKQALKGATGKAAAEVRKAVSRFTALRQTNMTDTDWDPDANGLDESSIVARLDGIMDPALSELAALESEHDLGPKDLQSGDPILSRLDAVTIGRIGAPYSHREIRELVEEATSFRFPNLIPPGYKDAGSKPTLYRSAGDYILWRQVLDYAAANARDRMLVMVTNDVKEDWWVLDKNGRAEQGRPELQQEIFDNSATSMIQMTLSDFLESAVEQFPGRVSRDTVTEVREAERAALLTQALSDFYSSSSEEMSESPGRVIELLAMPPVAIEHVVRQVLEAIGYTAFVTEPGPDVGFDIEASRFDAALGTIRTVAEVKRYVNAVGADAIRSLYGVMLHESAQEALAVTTSWFTPAAKRFAEGKPIRLIEGGELIELIRDHIGVEAVISVERPTGRPEL